MVLPGRGYQHTTQTNKQVYLRCSLVIASTNKSASIKWLDQSAGFQLDADDDEGGD